MCAISKNTRVGQKQSRVRRFVATFVVVQKLGGNAGHVIHDQVRHDYNALAQSPAVLPRAQARIDFCVIDQIEDCIGAINEIKKWKQVHAAEYAFQWPLNEDLKFPETSSGKTVNV